MESNMSDEFHEWLDQCPNQWHRITYDQNSATYMFINQDEQN